MKRSPSAFDKLGARLWRFLFSMPPFSNFSEERAARWCSDRSVRFLAYQGGGGFIHEIYNVRPLKTPKRFSWFGLRGRAAT